MNVAGKVLAIGGALSGTALAINYAFGGETIENYLKNSKEYKNKVFLNSTTEGLEDILKVYDTSARTKPKNKEGKPLAKEELVKWCESAIKGKYYGSEDDSFKAVTSWCYININTFEKQLEGSGKVKINEKQSNDKAWVDAWKKYSSENKISSLKITETVQDLNEQNAEKGQVALMKWCNEKATSKMYIDKAEEAFARFEHWCTKATANE